jgi:hypothetical protein
MINGVCFISGGPDAVSADHWLSDLVITSPRLRRVEENAPCPDAFLSGTPGKRF